MPEQLATQEQVEMTEAYFALLQLLAEIQEFCRDWQFHKLGVAQ